MALKHGNLTKIQNQNLCQYTWIFEEIVKILNIIKYRNNFKREKMNMKNSVLDYIKYKQLNCFGNVRRINKERLPQKEDISK